MGVREGVWWATAAALVTTALVGCSSSDDEDADDEHPPDSFDFPADELLVPGGDVREYELTSTGEIGQDYLDDGAGPLVVTSFEGQTAAATSVPVAAIEEREGPLLPDPELAEVAGRPTAHYGWQLAPLPDQADTSISWLATDDVLVNVASRTLDRAALVRLAEAVEVQADGGLRVPGDVVGEIPAIWFAPRPGVTATFERPVPNGSRRVEVAVVAADRSLQNAYLALAAPDGFLQETTHYSCCMGTMPPRRTLDVDGREATAVALSVDYHLVVLHGDHGAVILVQAGRSRSVPEDIWLADLASSLTSVAADDFTPIGPQPD